MKTLEFAATLTDKSLTIPPELSKELSPGQNVRVLLIVSELDEKNWSEAAIREFGMGYAESDAIYDKLSIR